MESYADSWYEVGNFWIGGMGVLVAAIVGSISIMATYRATVPKKKIIFGWPVITRLLGSINELRSDVAVEYKGNALTDPHFLRLYIKNNSRRDIPSAAYDAAKPLQFDVQCPVVEILSHSTDSELLPVSTSESKVTIGPGLIRRQSIVTVDSDFELGYWNFAIAGCSALALVFLIMGIVVSDT
jgi:hypothetical protein